MKKLFIAFCFAFINGALHAQTDNIAIRRQWDDVFMQAARDSLQRAATEHALPENDSLQINNACVPNLFYGPGAYGLGGEAFGYNDFSWRLHEGFNAQFGLSMTAGLGKHSPSGVGFGQTAAFAYVTPLTQKLTLAAGIFATNFDWGSWRRTDVGIGGALSYKVNDNVHLYLYGQKSFLPKLSGQWRHDPFPLFFDRVKDRIGAAAEFKIGQNAMIGINVEHRSY